MDCRVACAPRNDGGGVDCFRFAHDDVVVADRYGSLAYDNGEGATSFYIYIS